MARNLYGCTASDVAVTVGGMLVPGAGPYSLYTTGPDRATSEAITDLTDLAGVAVSEVTFSADGYLRYHGPDGDKRTHWLDTGQGLRVAVRPVGITGASAYEVAVMEGFEGTESDWLQSLTFAGSADAANVSYTQYGAGAVQRSLQSRLGETFSVKDFGAVGDDTADDTTEIQACITAAVAVGGTVVIPSGTYKITNVLTVTGKVTITGTGTIHQVTSGKGGFVVTGDDVTIEGIGVVGRHTGTPVQTSGELAVWAKGTSATSRIRRFAARNLRVTKWGFAGIWVEFADEWWVEGCTVTDLLYKAIEGKSADRGHVLFNTVDTIWPNSFANSYGVTFQGGAPGDLVARPNCRNVEVIGNRISNVPDWEGIDTHGVENLTIMANHVSNCDTGILAGAMQGVPATGFVIVGNTIENCPRGSIRVQGDSEVYTTAVVTGNRIINSAQMRCDFTEKMTIVGNAFEQPKVYGIQMAGDNRGFLIADNTFTDVWHTAPGGCAPIAISGEYNTGAIVHNTLFRGSKTGYVNDGFGLYNGSMVGGDVYYGTNPGFEKAGVKEIAVQGKVATPFNRADGVLLATVGAELGSGSGDTQALTGLTVGALYAVSVIGAGTLTSATLDGTAMTVNPTSSTSAFKATATAHTVAKTGGTATAISVKQVTARPDSSLPVLSGLTLAGHGTNTFVGTDTKTVLPAATRNVGVGTLAQAGIVSGEGNVALGWAAQNRVVSADGCIAIGPQAQYVLASGSYNIAIGDAAQVALPGGSGNVSIGRGALGVANTALLNSTSIGDRAHGALLSGTGNTALGASAGRAYTTGSYNTALGANAGYTGTTATLSGTVCIGTNAGGTGAQATANNDFILGTSAHNVKVAGTLSVSGSVGFYGTTPVAKPTGVAVTAEGIHAALVTLGLIAA